MTTRRVPITLTLFLYEDISDLQDSDDAHGNARFYLEENHCMDNYIDDLKTAIEKHPNLCQTCFRGEVRIGHHKPPVTTEIKAFDEWPRLVEDKGEKEDGDG